MKDISGNKPVPKIGFTGRIIEFFGGVPSEKFQQAIDEVKAERVGNYVQFGDSFALPFDGEKNLGEIGPIRNYWMNYPALRARSWQSYTESEITQTIIGRFTTWVIGSGLKLQSIPDVDILRDEGIEIDAATFSKNVEHRFRLYACNKNSSVSKMYDIHTLAREVFKAAKIGGDVLVILRYNRKSKRPEVQIIDGGLVASPISSVGNYPTLLDNGNEMRSGVEVTPEGRVVAYHVMQRNLKYERIEARSKTGHQVAFLVKGKTHRPGDVRGIPLISVILETLAKLDRYKEAAVGSAEERAKIPYFIEHTKDSDGENPLLQQLADAARGGQNTFGNTDGKLPQTIEGDELAKKVIASVNKQTFNMPVGAKINALDVKNEMFFKDFYEANIDVVCGALGIPPDVAFSKYENSYSSSRAALKDWEHTLKVERNDFEKQFYGIIYDFWMFTQVFAGKITAPGYSQAFIDGNEDVIQAYTQCRFVGDNVPHIDPLKEVTAERMKLGTMGSAIPLTTVEEAAEALNSGDGDANIEQFARELKLSESLGIKPAPLPGAHQEKPEKEEEE
jgi:capsid protein